MRYKDLRVSEEDLKLIEAALSEASIRRSNRLKESEQIIHTNEGLQKEQTATMKVIESLISLKHMIKEQGGRKLQVLVDHDNVEIVRYVDARPFFPELDWESVANRFVFTIGVTEVICMKDLMFCVRACEEGNKWQDYNYSEVEHCSVCKAVLMPDDEAYTDEDTGDVICDAHSRLCEDENCYVKVIP